MPTVLGAACALEGDLLRLAGDLVRAEAAYQRASEHGHDPQPGLALLRLAQGRPDAADAMIRRALGESQDPMSRARLLGPYVELVLAAADTTSAGPAAEELRGVAAAFGTPLLRAHAARAVGAVLLAEGDANGALVELRRAFNGFNELGVRYDAARTRLLLADACRELGDNDTAEIESRAARAALESLTDGSRRPTGAADGPHGLTQRELEVLRLLASGKTNRGIAQELVVSEKTVASHVSHIFTKLDVASRSAATAYAYDHNLV
jgi:DNA-binding NarL/FixJ family response regulator